MVSFLGHGMGEDPHGQRELDLDAAAAQANDCDGRLIGWSMMATSPLFTSYCLISYGTYWFSLILGALFLVSPSLSFPTLILVSFLLFPWVWHCLLFLFLFQIPCSIYKLLLFSVGRACATWPRLDIIGHAVVGGGHGRLTRTRCSRHGGRWG